MSSLSLPSVHRSSAGTAEAMNVPGGAADAAMTDPAAFGALLSQSMAFASPAVLAPGLPANEAVHPMEDKEREDPTVAVQDLLMLLPAEHRTILVATAPKTSTTTNIDMMSASAQDDPAIGIHGVNMRASTHGQALPETSALHRAETTPALSAAREHAEHHAAPDIGPLAEVAIASPHLPAPNDTGTAMKNDLSLHSALGSSGWNHEFSQQIRWMTKHELHSASLSLNPPELGPIRVELQLTGKETTASFSSPLPEVRQAIEAAMPELKAMLEESGLNLAGASVEQDNRHLQHRNERERHAHRPTSTSDDTQTNSDETDSALPRSAAATGDHRLLDLYA